MAPSIIQPLFAFKQSLSLGGGWKQKLLAIKPTAIRSKIAGGYIIALGIPVLGASIGILIGNHYQAEADRQLTEIRQDQKMLLDLQLNILSNLPAKSLSPFTDDPKEFRSASKALLKRIQIIRNLTQQLAAVDRPLLAQQRSTFRQYLVTIDQFAQYVEKVIQRIQPLTSAATSRAQIDTEIGQLLRSQEFSSFIVFTNVLESLNLDADRGLLTAVQQRREAENLRMIIAMGSIVVAALVSVALVRYTSRAIAQPIEQLALLAQEVTHDANTHLRAKVTTVDEVGTLARSVNQLIEWVENYTNELKAAQLQLVQTEKMSSLGELVGGLAHEINNPISFIYGNLNYVDQYVRELIKIIYRYQEKYPEENQHLENEELLAEIEFIVEDLPKLLNSMKFGAERIRELVVSLRNFSRLDEAEIKAVNLHEGLENTLLMMRHRLQSAADQTVIEVAKHYATLPEIECYPAQLNQVFMNVIANAIDVLSQGTVAEPVITIQTEMLAPDRVRVKISDNGPGIEESIQSKLFDPFFTTKPIGQGTGLGLAIAYQVVQQHGGQIMVMSRLGHGATIQIDLPTSQASIDDSPLAMSPSQAPCTVPPSPSQVVA